jgi:hypothetical protein
MSRNYGYEISQKLCLRNFAEFRKIIGTKFREINFDFVLILYFAKEKKSTFVSTLDCADGPTSLTYLLAHSHYLCAPKNPIHTGEIFSKKNYPENKPLNCVYRDGYQFRAVVALPTCKWSKFLPPPYRLCSEPP